LYGNKSPNVHRGRYSGGISLYYKNTLTYDVKVVDTNQNGIIWMKISNNLLDFQEDVFLCIVYIPPFISPVIDRQNFDFFEEIETKLEYYKLHGRCFIVGDLNSRTSNECEILRYDEYIDNDDQLINVNIPPRVSRDTTIDSFGKRLIEFCQSVSFVIANGRIHKDRFAGDFTFHSQNGSSVVDYLLSHRDCLHSVTDFTILEPNEFSDHNGIHFTFPRKDSLTQQSWQRKIDIKINWNNEKNK
jgi:hypothetical protein